MCVINPCSWYKLHFSVAVRVSLFVFVHADNVLGFSYARFVCQSSFKHVFVLLWKSSTCSRESESKAGFPCLINNDTIFLTTIGSLSTHLLFTQTGKVLLKLLEGRHSML